MTDNDAQWWWVEHHGRGGWSVSPTRERSRLITIQKHERDAWLHTARVHCPRSQAEQAACDAWAEAGFAHAPKHPPAPEPAKMVWWSVQQKDSPLGDCMLGKFDSASDARKYARKWDPTYQFGLVVKVDMTVTVESEGE